MSASSRAARRFWKLSRPPGFILLCIGTLGLSDVIERRPFAQTLTTPAPPPRRMPVCRGEAATKVVEAGESWDGTTERDVVVILGNGAEIWTSLGDDLVCVHGDARGDAYGHGSRINLGPGHNTIITYGGSNYIISGDGNDFIYLNGEMEDVEAGAGDDHIWALGAASATIAAGDGNDLIVGSPGGDHLDGGDHDDVIMGNGGNDDITGGEGNDTLYGNAGVDGLNGGNGQDECIDNLPAGAILTSCEVQTGGPWLPETSNKATP